MTIQAMYEQATLACASYGLKLPWPLPTQLNDKIKVALTANANEVKMSSSEADQFLTSKWEVVARYPADASEPTQEERDSYGAAATVFRNTETGQVSIAVRGTETLLNDIGADVVLAVIGVDTLNPQFNALYARIKSWATGPDAILSGTVTITGHSLGGYLAAQLKKAFAAPTADTGDFNISSAYVFNAPGPGGVLGSLTRVVSLPLGKPV